MTIPAKPQREPKPDDDAAGPSEVVARGDPAAIIALVDTGPGDFRTTRALVVFNLGDTLLRGSVCFQTCMRWPEARRLPALRIGHLRSGRVCPHRIDHYTFQMSKAEAGYGLLSFDLWFDASDVAPKGWDTYIAAYTPIPDPRSGAQLAAPAVQDYTVLETLPHTGPLPPTWPPSP